MSNISKEWMDRLKSGAEVCVEHIDYLDKRSQEGLPITNEEIGMLALGRLYLVMYGYILKGEIPEFANDLFEDKKIN